MHLRSPPTLSWEGVSAWGLDWAEGLLGGLVVGFRWASLEVSGCLSGCEVFSGDVVVDSDLGVSEEDLVLDWAMTVVVVGSGFGGSGVGIEVDVLL